MRTKGHFSSRERRLLVTVRGDLLSTNAAACMGECRALCESHPGCLDIVLRLLTAKMVDSVGLNALLDFALHLRAQGKTLTLRTSSTSVLRVLEFARFDQVAKVENPSRDRQD